MTQGNQYLKPILIECSWCATNIKECYLKRKYEGLIGRRGKKRAFVAVAHKVLITIYYILKDKVSCKDLGYHYLDERKKTSQVKSYKLE